ncbi:energy-coupling factor transporter transmembrane component T family protein [Synechocystis sp. PCC 7509]|uniref:energy-coupling factor transporter transmembrane component T family protein n=1 Tax=Synechocystis sp. PCC 7509 TaxID=927677 RepID=UPI0002ABC88F|nr:CbiQ family ECF transporter T component [Synechocystis sp. PCC 7509]
MDLLRNLPLGLYLEQPITWLHKLDPRVKLIWLLSFLAAPILASSPWRIALVLMLIAITLTAKIPLRAWKQQMGWLLMLSGFVFLLGAFVPDSFNVKYQPRLPPIDPSLAIASDYQYVLFQIKGFTITRRSLELAIRVSTLIFNVIYSSNLYLLTTAPEEITAGIESLMRPLRRFKVPVTEIALTLTLSLRFIPLVLEEVQNLIRSVNTRAINWKKLGVKGAIRVWMLVAERLLENLLLRAEQMANAMTVRGFTSPNTHRVQWQQLRLKTTDGMAIALLIIFWIARWLPFPTIN